MIFIKSCMCVVILMKDIMFFVTCLWFLHVHQRILIESRTRLMSSMTSVMFFSASFCCFHTMILRSKMSTANVNENVNDTLKKNVNQHVNEHVRISMKALIRLSIKM